MSGSAIGSVAPPAAVDGTGSAYAGLVTRALAFAVDGAIVNGVAWFVGLVVALGLSLVEIPDRLTTLLVAIGTALALVWSVAYFTFFWSTTGQTPGNRVMGIEIRAAAPGEALRARRALARVLLLPLSVIPLGAGVLMILVDRRRRALHDRLAGTVVVYDAEPPRPVERQADFPPPHQRASLPARSRSANSDGAAAAHRPPIQGAER
jgi:uncharacterized RDD family membrane protein YckC